MFMKGIENKANFMLDLNGGIVLIQEALISIYGLWVGHSHPSLRMASSSSSTATSPTPHSLKIVAFNSIFTVSGTMGLLRMDVIVIVTA